MSFSIVQHRKGGQFDKLKFMKVVLSLFFNAFQSSCLYSVVGQFIVIVIPLKVNVGKLRKSAHFTKKMIQYMNNERTGQSVSYHTVST